MSAKKRNSGDFPKGQKPAASRRPAPRRRSQALNWRVLVWTLVGLVVGAGGAWLWHVWQVKDLAGGAIEQGRELESKAEDLAGQARDLLAEARGLEAEARDLQEKAHGDDTQGRRDEAQKLFQRAQSRIKEAHDARQAAAQYFLHYSQRNPNDPEGPLALARLSEKDGNVPAAIDWYAGALRAADNQNEVWPLTAEVRACRAELLVALGQYFQREASRSEKDEQRDSAEARYSQAYNEANTVLDEEASDAESRSKAMRALALAALGLHDLDATVSLSDQFDSIGEIVEQAYQDEPGDSELALALARMYRDFPDLLSERQREKLGPDDVQEERRFAAADTIMQQLVDSAEQNFQKAPGSREVRIAAANARLNRFRYLAAYDLPGADADLARALELAPDSANVQLLAGSRLLAGRTGTPSSGSGDIVADEKKLTEACQHFRAARDLQYGNPTAYLGLAEAYRRLGEDDRAIQEYENGLRNVGENDWDLNFALVDALLTTNTITKEEAERRFRILDKSLSDQRSSLSELALRSRTARRDLLFARWLVSSEQYADAAELLDRLLLESGLASSNEKAGPGVNRNEVLARLLLAKCCEAQARERLAMPGRDPLTQTATAAPNEASREEAQAFLEKAAETYKQLARDLPHIVQFREAAAKMYLAAGRPDQAVLYELSAIDLEDTLDRRFFLTHARLEQLKQDTSSDRLMEAVENELDHLETRIQQEPIEQPWTIDAMRAELLTIKSKREGAKDVPDDALAMLRELEEKYPLSLELFSFLVRRYEELKATDDVARASACRDIAMAFSLGTPGDAEVPEDRLKELVGEEALLWRFLRANRLLMEPGSSPSERKNQIQEAKQLSDGILADRPDWTQAHLLAASVERAEGNLVDAVPGLEKAYELEPTNLRTLEKLVRLQLQLGQTKEAEARIEKARAAFPASDAVLRLEMLVKHSAGDREAAIELARKEVASRPRDSAARMRLGLLLQQGNELDEAEKAFREALLLKPDDPTSMAALFALYGRTDKKDAAVAMLQELASNEKLKPREKELILARGYETLERSAEAEEHYGAAEKAYREDVEAEPDNASLRLGFAELLLSHKDAAKLELAAEEVRQVLDAVPNSRDAQRLLARILWRRNEGDDRQKASAIYDTLAATPEAGVVEDQYRRAQMLESQGNFEAATEAFDKLLESAALSPNTLAAQVNRSLRLGQIDKAEQTLARLEKVAPGNLRTLRLKLQVLHRTNRDDEIKPLVQTLQQKLAEQAGDDPARTAKVSQIIGDLYSSVDMHAEAEPHYQALATAEPASVKRLAACVAAQGRTQEAIQLVLDTGEKTDDLVKADALCRIFVNSTPSDEEWSLAKPVLESAAASHADHAGLHAQIGNVYIVRGDLEEAVQWLEKAVALQPDNVLILNNLASILGEQPGQAEKALGYIDRAIQLSSSAPGLLDTKGTILLHLDRPAEAVAVLDQAVSGDAQDPRFRLHLAVACDRVGDGVKAKQMLAGALQGQLLERPEYILTNKDKNWLEELKKTYEL